VEVLGAPADSAIARRFLSIRRTSSSDASNWRLARGVRSRHPVRGRLGAALPCFARRAKSRSCRQIAAMHLTTS